MDSMSTIVVLLILVALSAYFSATETAFTSLNRIRMKNLAAEGNRRAELVLDLAEKYDQILTTILIGNNIVNIAATSLATVLFIQYFADKGATLSTVVMTLVVLVFGEVTPKTLAKENPETFAMWSAPYLRALKIVLTPLNAVFIGWRKLLDMLFTSKRDNSITEDEIMTMVDEAQEEGGIDEHEGDLIRSAIEFTDLDVADILTPRVDVIALDADATVEEAAALFEEHGFSRLPVYEESVDKTLGVIHEKDFHALRKQGVTCIRDMIKPAISVSPGLKISQLLQLLQHSKNHMAIVVDEFGGTEGIVTLEDVLEELVGEIWDEHDEVMEDVRTEGEKCFIIEGSADVDKVFEQVHLDEECEWATLNGWVVDMMNCIPQAGQSFTYKHLTVTVTQADSKKVLEVRVEVGELPEDEADGSEKDTASAQ